VTHSLNVIKDDQVVEDISGDEIPITGSNITYMNAENQQAKSANMAVNEGSSGGECQSQKPTLINYEDSMNKYI